MNLTNKQIRARARHLLDDNIFGKDWLKSVLTLVISFIIEFVIVWAAAAVTSTIVGLISTILIAIFPQADVLLLTIISWFVAILAELLVSMGISGNMAIGIASVNIDLVRGDGHISIKKFFYGFKNFVEDFVLGFMVTLQVALWSLLFIVPGIYVALSYALVYHVKYDHPEFTWRDCLDESERLMTGNRWRYLKLCLSFLGWEFIGSVAFSGVGSLWVTAYMNTSIAVFYDQVKVEKESGENDLGYGSSTSPVIYSR